MLKIIRKQVMMTEVEVEKAEKLAGREGLTFSALIRALIYRELAKVEK